MSVYFVQADPEPRNGEGGQVIVYFIQVGERGPFKIGHSRNPLGMRYKLFNGMHHDKPVYRFVPVNTVNESTRDDHGRQLRSEAWPSRQRSSSSWYIRAAPRGW